MILSKNDLRDSTFIKDGSQPIFAPNGTPEG
jgi:hypothetical protein